jgi:hypothetical protein
MGRGVAGILVEVDTRVVNTMRIAQELERVEHKHVCYYDE